MLCVSLSAPSTCYSIWVGDESLLSCKWKSALNCLSNANCWCHLPRMKEGYPEKSWSSLSPSYVLLQHQLRRGAVKQCQHLSKIKLFSKEEAWKEDYLGALAGKRTSGLFLCLTFEGIDSCINWARATKRIPSDPTPEASSQGWRAEESPAGGSLSSATAPLLAIVFHLKIISVLGHHSRLAAAWF